MLSAVAVGVNGFLGYMVGRGLAGFYIVPGYVPMLTIVLGVTGGTVGLAVWIYERRGRLHFL